MDQATVQFDALIVQIATTLVGALGVGLTIFWNSKIAKRRATLDVLLQSQSTEVLIDNRTRFVELVAAGNLEQWADHERVNTKDAAVVRSALNRYELIALGVNTGALDRGIYKRWNRATLVQDWIVARLLVERLRTESGVETYYAEFKTLARAWATVDELPHVLSEAERWKLLGRVD